MSKSIIYNNDITRERIVCEVDNKEVYKITYQNGNKDLVNILSQDLFVNIYSILNREYYKLGTKEFETLYNMGKVESLNML